MREHGCGLGNFAELAVQILNGIGGVDNAAYLRGLSPNTSFKKKPRNPMTSLLTLTSAFLVFSWYRAF